jgi:ribosome maturation factor RimP
MAERNRDTIVNQISEIAERVASSEGIEIVEAQVLGGGGARVVRIYIDKPEGVSHSDCELISQQVGTILDVENVIPGARYTLEVSSPGLERKLSKPRDFERFLGSKIKVVLRDPVENQRRFEGVLTGFSEGIITLEAATGKSMPIALDQVEKANLKFEW